MNIIIVGDGKVGYTLAELLSQEDHNVTIVDNNSEALRKADDALDVMCIKGNGASISVLREAGAEHADALIAATDLDEVNMVCCLNAKHLGTSFTVARVRNVEYTMDVNAFKRDMGIDLLINPERATAVEIARLLRFPSAANIETFYRGRVELMSFRAREEDFFLGQPLSALSDRIKDLPILFCAADRNGEVIIPDGSFVPQVEDRIYLIGAPVGVHEFFKLIGRYASHIRNVFVVGGGRITFHLTSMLERMNMHVKIVELKENRCRQLSEALPHSLIIMGDGGGGRITFHLTSMLERMNMHVKIVELKENRCRQLSEALPHSLIIMGDGTDQELLESENLEESDAFVALTDRDEDNLIISLYAMQRNVPKVVAKCNRQNYTGIVRHLGLESVISPKLFTANQILQIIRGRQNSKGSVMNTLYKIGDSGAEAMEFVVNQTTHHLGTPLKELHLKKGVLLAVIIHQGRTIIPEGSSVISLGDTVIVISSGHGILDINDIFDDSILDHRTDDLENDALDRGQAL